MYKFKTTNTLKKRKKDSKRILAKYPNRVPVIVEKSGKNIPDLDKFKYLVPCDITLGQFLYVIRSRIKLSSDQSIFLFVNEISPPCSINMKQLYDQYSDEDGFLYITYTGESTFG